MANFIEQGFSHIEYGNGKIRLALASDLPALCKLEELCWAEGTRMPKAVILERISRIPAGNYVLELEGRVAAVIYSQTIPDVDSIMESCDEEILSLHDGNGRVAQLIKLNVLPEMRTLGLGEQLLEFMLQRLQSVKGIETIIAVTKCKEYSLFGGIDISEYIAMRDERGEPIDSLLRFHSQHGAQIKGLVPNYRSGDRENRGYGVLVSYDVKSEIAASRQNRNKPETHAPGSRRLDRSAVEAAVQAQVRNLLPGNRRTGFSHIRPLMEMGIDSLGLSELRTTMLEYWGVKLEPTFFFRHPTAKAITDYIVNTLKSNENMSSLAESYKSESEIRDILNTPETTTARNTFIRSYKNDDIAIVGMSLRFPGDISSQEAFWALLESRQDVLGLFPALRCEPRHAAYLRQQQGAKYGGFLTDIAGFDAGFFRISPKEAELMDPQQRLLLELSWETLEDAGCRPEGLSGTSTGVFVGACHYDYRELLELNALAEQGHFSTGNGASILANRLSYFYNFRGPSLTIDTACSSSLVAFHEAIQSIQRGECDLALSGGVNIICSTTNSLTYQAAGMLASDGKCKAFSRSANGYVRSEGAALLLLKPLQNALGDGNRIYGVIKGSAVNHGGEAASLTAPNPAAQAALLADAYKKANIPFATVGYLEAHGTGTALGDPIEIEGIQQAFSELVGEENTRYRCGIGSVKTNIGHLESAAGVAGVIKVLLAMERGRIPGIANFESLNPDIDLSGSHFFIADTTTEWQHCIDDEGRILPYRAGVSSFGFGGANAHLVLEQAPSEEACSRQESSKYLLVLSAKNPASLKQYAAAYADHIVSKKEQDIGDICYTAALGRSHFEYRLAMVGEDKKSLHEKLRNYIAGTSIPQSAGIKAGGRPASMEFNGEEDTLLNSLAHCYLQGMEVDWKELYSGKKFRIVTLPTYPFGRERYWFKQSTTACRNIDKTSILGSEISLAGNERKTSHFYYQKRLSATGLAYLFDHCVLNRAVMPGAAFIELFLLAAKAFTKGSVLILRSISFHRPLFIEAATVLQTVVKRKGEAGDFDVEVWAREEQTDKPWVLYASARIVNQQQPCDSKKELAFESNPSRQVIDRAEFYQWCSNIGYQYGESFRVLKKLDIGEKSLSAVACMPDIIRSVDTVSALHPTLLDAAFQLAIALFRENLPAAGQVALPVTVESLRVCQSACGEICIEALSSNKAAVGENEVCDIFLSDSAGRPVADIEGLTFRKVNRINFGIRQNGSQEDIFNHFLYTPKWISSTTEENSKKTGLKSANEKILIVFPDYASSLLSALLDQLGYDAVIVARYARVDRKLSNSSYEIQAGDAEAFNTLCREHHEIAHVLFFGGFHRNTDHPPADMDVFDQYQTQGVYSLFHLIKNLNACDMLDRKFKLKVVTNFTCPVRSGDNHIPWGGGVLGLSSVFAKEYSSVESIGIDVDWIDNNNSANIAQTILNEPTSPQGGVVAYRSGQRYCLINHATQIRAAREENLPYKRNGVYLIIGGAGGIGSVFSRKLAQKYKANIIWVGRRELDENIQSKISEIENLGGTVYYYQADACNLKEMQFIVQQAEARIGKIQGVVHSALQLKDRMLANMPFSEFKASFDVKAKASWVLQESCKEQPLDFVLYFSSALVFFNNPGQSNYISGSIFQDNFAHYLKAERSMPVKVINWGYWSSVGAVVSPEYARQLERIGFEGIEVEEGIEAIERILGSSAIQVMAVKARAESLKEMKVADNVTMLWLPRSEPIDLSKVCESRALKEPSISWPRLGESYAAINKWCASLLLSAFQSMGVFVNGCEAYNTIELREKLGIADRYRALLTACLEILRVENIIDLEGQRVILSGSCAKQLSKFSMEEQRETLKTLFPWLKPIIGLLWESYSHFSDILTGRTLATEILFPDSSLYLVEDYYRHDPFIAYRNDQLTDFAFAIGRELNGRTKQRKLKVIEIGAGTGATTRKVLPLLSRLGVDIEFIYTDLSLAFLEYGRGEFSDIFPFVSFKLLDIERPPGRQGFDEGEFDLVLATNVLHATSSISNTLKNIKYLLSAGGVLLANELTQKQHYLTLTFGLLDGWWLAEDKMCRIENSPLLTVPMWRDALLKEGFVECYFPKVQHEKENEFIPQHIVMAKSDGYIPLDVNAEQEKGAEVSKYPGAPSKAFDRTVKELVNTPKEEVFEYYLEYLRYAASAILRIQYAKLNSLGKPFEDTSLAELGLDSLLSVELRNKLRADLGMDFPVKVFITSKVSKLVGLMSEQLLIKHLNANGSSDEVADQSAEESMETFIL